jgi:hypothetical protein
MSWTIRADDDFEIREQLLDALGVMDIEEAREQLAPLNDLYKNEYEAGETEGRAMHHSGNWDWKKEFSRTVAQSGKYTPQIVDLFMRAKEKSIL